jgi:N utilization substance protein A
MTEEELGEVPGIGERSVERIATAVRHYFGHYNEGEARPTDAPAPEPLLVAGEEAVAEAAASDEAGDEVHSMRRTPEEILAEQAAAAGGVTEVTDVSTEEIAAAEDMISASDANDAADAREEQIELRNDTIDRLVDDAQDFSDEGIDSDGHDRR